MVKLNKDDWLGYNSMKGCSVYECANHTEWTKIRKNYITASESACVLGIGFHDNVWLWEEKTGAKHDDTVSEATERLMRRGNINEKLSRQQWENESGHYVVDGTLKLVVNDTILDANGKPFLAATLDAIGIESKEGGKEPYIIELKYSESTKLFKNGLPPKYRCQMLKQMIVTGLNRAILLARIVWFDIYCQRHVSERMFELSREDEDVANDIASLIEVEKHFWNDFVLTKRRPPIVLPTI